MSDGSDKKAKKGDRLSANAAAELNRHLEKFNRELVGNRTPAKTKEATGLGFSQDPIVDLQIAMAEKKRIKANGQSDA